MHLGLRSPASVPESYKGFHLVRTHGRYYAAPGHLDIEDLLRSGALWTHGAVMSAATLEEIQTLIDTCDVAQLRPEVIEHCGEYDLVRHRDEFVAIRRAAGEVDLDLAEERQRAGAIPGISHDQLRQRVADLDDASAVEFAGWLPIFEFSGNCGKHPQFTHTAEPPPGYRFSCSAPAKTKSHSRWKKLIGKMTTRVGQAAKKAILAVRPFFSMLFGGPRVGLRTRFQVLGTVGRLGLTLLRRGAKIGATVRFLQSRHFHSQLLIAKSQDLVFLTSMPYTYGQNPWIVEIEDPTTLFYPMIHNGRTCNLDIQKSPYFPIIKTLLESDSCKGILTHMKSTAELVPTLFGSETIRNKVMYAPLGVKVPSRWHRHDEENDPDELHLLFLNSWCQVPSNFYLRGGLDILEAFATLRVRYPQLRLTMRTHLPALDDHYHRIMEGGWVRIINRFATAHEMAELHANSHIYLLPAARVHIVSLLQAMSYGLPVVVSDGWGFEEYVTHERNGLVVRGRYGKVSWADTQAGILREDYEPMYTSDPEVVAGIIESVSRLVEDRALRARLGRTARADVETKYNLARWNEGLKQAFDRARGVAEHGVFVPFVDRQAFEESTA